MIVVIGVVYRLVARPVADGGEGLELDLEVDISEEEGPEYPPTTST